VTYEYECAKEHRTEADRLVSERHDPLDCPRCGLPARLVMSLPLPAICYGNDRSGGKSGPGGIEFTGPAQRARWAKENGQIEVGNDTGAVTKQMQESRKAEDRRRRQRNKEMGVKLAREMGARHDDIAREFGGEKWAS